MAGYEVDGVRKAFAAVRLLATSPEPIGITDISRSLGISKAAAFRLMHTLCLEGVTMKDRATKTYRLGPDLAHLGHVASEDFTIRRAALPVMESLTSRLGLPTYLNVAGSRDVVCLEHVESKTKLNLYGRAGLTLPYHACPSGYVLLSWSMPDAVDRITESPMPRYAMNTPRNRDQLQTTLEETRDRGYAFGSADLEDGASSLAAPIYGASGSVVASLGIAGWSVMVDERREQIGWTLMDAAAEIAEAARSGNSPII